MNILLGIGNARHGDDALGPVFARWFRQPGWLSIVGGTAPENHTSAIRRVRPATLILLDAADMGLAAGSLRQLQPEQTRDIHFGSHAPALSQLAGYLSMTDAAKQILILGIQPLSLAPTSKLSPPVHRALLLLRQQLRENNLNFQALEYV